MFYLSKLEKEKSVKIFNNIKFYYYLIAFYFGWQILFHVIHFNIIIFVLYVICPLKLKMERCR